MQIALKVARDGGKVESLRLEAASEAVAVRLAASRGYRVLAIDLGHDKPAPSSGEAFSLVLFSQELLALLEAGLTLVEALEALRNKEQRAPVRAFVEGLLSELREGRNFSDVLADRPEQFPELYVATVRAAERSGNLPDALSRYVAYRLQFDAVRKKLVSASIYPLMLIAVGLMVTLFLLGYVVPKFSAVYESAGRDTHWLSGLLLAVGRSIYHHWAAWGAAAAAAIAALVVALRSPPLRGRLLAQVLRLPALARRSKDFRLARFYRTLALLLNAGIPLAKGMAMSAGLFDARDAQALARARRAIEEGRPFSAALEQEGLATPIALSLVTVGERSGRLADMLERAARFHDEEFARWLDVASRLLEPVLMTVMGLVIGAVVVLLYLPIFDLAGSLQ